ncbi:MAG: system, phosphocarrier protein HPr component [Microbacteriaceae bacterium]|jgi:phosphocarrier protein HPr|nr:system, phosphocarrier protein HPr component [Microbacteriaceae bacterium]HEV7956186.1 HPr family phosphocarrier protein [Marisediminicola sp.]
MAEQPVVDQLAAEPVVVEKRVVIASAHGLHARPASLFTQAASRSGIPVQIAKAGKSVNAASILGVISLGIEHDDEVLLTATGDNAHEVLAELVSLLSTDFDAE